MCLIEDILSKQPNLRVLHDPPGLAGQRVRYVLLFHLDPESKDVRRCKVRAYAWTVRSLSSRLAVLDKDLSALFAGNIFDVARENFKNGNPNELRDRGENLSLQSLLL